MTSQRARAYTNTLVSTVEKEHEMTPGPSRERERNLGRVDEADAEF